jgi:chromosome segregation ATPase
MENETTMSMREYSRLRAVTYEAVRAQVARYNKELEGHITKENGSKKLMLDDWAIKFLDKHRQQRTVVMKASTDETEKELIRLRERVEQLQAELFATNKELIELHKSREKLIEDNARNEALLMIADKEHDQLEQTRQELSKANTTIEVQVKELDATKKELDTKQTELNKYHKTLFGLYRKD